MELFITDEKRSSRDKFFRTLFSCWYELMLILVSLTDRKFWHEDMNTAASDGNCKLCVEMQVLAPGRSCIEIEVYHHGDVLGKIIHYCKPDGVYELIENLIALRNGKSDFQIRYAKSRRTTIDGKLHRYVIDNLDHLLEVETQKTIDEIAQSCHDISPNRPELRMKRILMMHWIEWLHVIYGDHDGQQDVLRRITLVARKHLGTISGEMDPYVFIEQQYTRHVELCEKGLTQFDLVYLPHKNVRMSEAN